MILRFYGHIIVKGNAFVWWLVMMLYKISSTAFLLFLSTLFKSGKQFKLKKPIQRTRWVYIIHNNSDLLGDIFIFKAALAITFEEDAYIYYIF
jgi:hypothetical protein